MRNQRPPWYTPPRSCQKGSIPPLSPGPETRPHISEWFGHRIFPVVSASGSALADQKAGRCPFLSDVLHVTKACVKSANSRGVCTISATSNGSRQDWLVCPYRALDDGLLVDMTRRLYNLSADVPVLLRPVPALDDDAERQKIMSALDDSDTRVFVYFQEKLGGEIGLPKTPASPDMSFDIAVVELLADGPSTPVVAEPQVRVGRYGVIEMQTTDTHGSYMQAVKALTGALDLHPASFHEQLAANAEWAGRKIEGPNISNVFKRTFYQISPQPSALEARLCAAGSIRPGNLPVQGVSGWITGNASSNVANRSLAESSA
jgi:hypothetical protein